MSLTLTQLFIFPVKSLRGIPVTQATLTPLGLLWDRHWMIVKPDGGFITQRQLPKMVLIHTQLTETHLVLSKAGMPDLSITLCPSDSKRYETFQARVWKDNCDVIDEGEQASQWLTQALETPKTLRLVRMANHFIRPQSKPQLLGESTSTRFADAAPYLVCYQASLDAVNRSLENNQLAPVSIEHFRPNLVLEGTASFEERNINLLTHSNYRLQQCYPCQRCIVPTIDIHTGERNPQQQPFSLISELNSMPDNNKAPAFGENAILNLGENQIIRIGDVLTASYGES